ncbi:methyltransferase domain-containing protein [Coraliomargarita parva]|uniref:methyltransferase domain-containing protein n=1 Tax=Coraliomargarita parva TaxID=3014050 RepID=UPI0022B4896E|nr:methyltransferase domain-containing protein [Coraliomargarita parva]
MSRDWNAAYLNDETPWDKGMPSPPLMEFLKRRQIAGTVLIPGCGLGHDVRLLAGQGAKVLGMDIAPAAVERARRVPPVADERFEAADFLTLPDEYVGRFDWVIEHTCLCALDLSQRTEYVESVCRALKPGGYYLAVFYRMIPHDDGNGPPFPISEASIDALFGGVFDILERFVPSESYSSRPYGCEEVCYMQLNGGC